MRPETDKVVAVRELVTRWYGEPVHTNPNGTAEEFERELRAILEGTRIKVPAGTHLRYRDYRQPEDAPMDRTGVVETWGNKWVTIKNDETGKTEWSTLTGCQRLQLTQETQTEATTAQTQSKPNQRALHKAKRNRNQQAVTA